MHIMASNCQFRCHNLKKNIIKPLFLLLRTDHINMFLFAKYIKSPNYTSIYNSLSLWLISLNLKLKQTAEYLETREINFLLKYIA